MRIIAGPNGSGKTTLFGQLGKQIRLYDFINADDIKVRLERDGSFSLPFDLEQDELVGAVQASSFDDSVKQFFLNGSILCCGKEIRFLPKAITSYSVAAFADFLRGAYLKRGISFTVETVFSHPSKLEFLSLANELGYRVYLYFVATESCELNVARVEQRVAAGGHDVPRDKIIKRYYSCLDNFYDALPFAYRAYFWDNSTSEMTFFAELKPNRQMIFTSSPPLWFENCILKKIPSRVLASAQKAK